MKKYIKLIIFTVLLLIAALFIFASQKKEDIDTFIKPNNIELESSDIVLYEKLWDFIDDGDYIAFVEELNSDVNYENAFMLLLYNSEDVVHNVIVDALSYLSKENKYQDIISLRRKGYISDACFIDYWEGTDVSNRLSRYKPTDGFIINELLFEYEKNNAAINSFITMREDGVIDDIAHDALVSALGFDYMDVDYVSENIPGAMNALNNDEQAMLNFVMNAIDSGDSNAIVEKMLCEEITLPLYRHLLSTDAETIEYVIADGLHNLYNEKEFTRVLVLRLMGYVTDNTFEIYLEMKGNGTLDTEYINEIPNDIDPYIIYELEKIYSFEGKHTVENIWKTGLLEDKLYNEFLSRIK